MRYLCNPLYLLLFLSISVPIVGFSQHADTTWWSKPNHPRSIIENNNGKIHIRCWHQNDLLMSSGIFKIDGGYIPVSDVLIVDSNNNKVQEYIFERGLLVNYFADGSIKDSLHAPLNEVEQNFVEYYTSRVVKKQWSSRKDSAKNGIVFYPFSNNEPRLSFMYQQTGFVHNLDEEFYPSGSIYKRMVYDQKILYRTSWYTPEGEIDATSYLGATSTGHQLIKEGRRLDWWNNGSLKSEKNYKKDYEDGPQRNWYENGQLQVETFMKEGSNDSITRIWYPDGQLKYYSDYRFKTEPRVSISFFPNGNVERQEMAVTCTYDENGNLKFESFGMGDYSRYFDDRNGAQNHNHYDGRFVKMRLGKWKAWDAKGRPMYVTTYENGLTEGETLIYDTLGNLRSRISYHEGRMHGPYIVFQKNGKDTASYGSFNMGRRWGTWKQFYSNGKPESVVVYGDKTYDELVRYNEKGEVTLETIYDRKKKLEIKNQYQDNRLYVSTVKHIDPPSLKLRRAGQSTEGSSRVDRYEYFPDGKPRRFMVYQKDGSVNEKSWFENGRPEMKGQRKDNVAFGRFTMWYANGNKRYEGTMRNGVRDGEWIYYNEDGSVASHPYFEDGVELVTRPQDNSCFCNKTYPPLKNSFMNSAESFITLKEINLIMHRFQLDTGFNSAFVGCVFCYPKPIYVYKDILLKVGKDGMYLNFTPCKQGHNYGIMEVEPTYTHSTNDYEEDSEVLRPPVLSQAVGRTIGILDSWNDPFLHSQALADITGDGDLFRKFLETSYNIRLNEAINTGEKEQDALSKVEELYTGNHRDGAISFEKDFAQKLSALLIKIFPAQAAVLKNKPTDRDAINSIIENYFSPDMDRLGPFLYGALSVSIDSGSVSLHIPAGFVTAYDGAKNKVVYKNGKPVGASFFLSFREAQYNSWPKDELVIRPEYTYNHCAQEFAIGKKGAWMKPVDFEFNFREQRDNAYDSPFDSYDYPFHYKKEASKITDRAGEFNPDGYTSNFMGVVIKSGELHVPGLNTIVTANNVLLDAKEMNGQIRLATHDMRFTKEELEKALINAGFKIINGETDNKEEILLYFNCK